MEVEGVFLRPNLTDNPIAFTLSDLDPVVSSQTLTSGGADIEDMTSSHDWHSPRIGVGPASSGVSSRRVAKRI
jgi:hypothetical protein